MFPLQGLFSPDRDPHPAVAEIKFLQQPVDIAPVLNSFDGSKVIAIGEKNPKLSLRVRNRYSFRDLSHLIWSWDLVSNRSMQPIRSGHLEMRFDSPDQVVCINLESVLSRIRMLEKTKPHLGNSYFLNVYGCLRQAHTWASAGHELVSNQFEIAFILHEIALFTPMQSPYRPTSRFMLETTSDANSFIIQSSAGGESMPLVVIDKYSGTIISYAPHGRNLLHSEGIIPNFVRASTDNDRGGMELALEFLFPRFLFIRNAFRFLRGTKDFSYWSHWRNVGLDGVAMPKVSCARIRITDDSNEDKVHVIALCSVHSPDGLTELFRLKLHYRIFADGRVQIANHVMPLPCLQMITSLPRVGLTMQLDPSLYQIQYFGRGPHENYPDRKSSARYGVFETTPNNMAYKHYIVPGENGSRSDCEYMSFRSETGNGFCVVETKADGEISPFCCSAQLHSISELHEAIHTCDLQKRGDGKYPIHVNIDHKLMGLGGDNRYENHEDCGRQIRY